jgi:PPP family 3-phenylpropionic acid transporter
MAINWYFSIHLIVLGAPGEVVGSAWAIGALVEIPIMAAYPWVGSRVGSERLLVIGAGVFALRAVVLSLVNDPILAAATMALHGVAFALVLVGGVTFVSRHAPAATAATAQGILSAVVFGVAWIVGPWIGSWVADSFGVPALFSLAWTTSVVAIPAVWLATRAALEPVAVSPKPEGIPERN